MAICEECDKENDGRFCNIFCVRKYNGKHRKKRSVESKRKQSGSVSGSRNPMFGKSIYDVWISKYGKEEADRKWIEYKKTLRNRVNRRTTSNYNVWLEKYGKEEADRRREETNRKHSESTRGEKSCRWGISNYDIWLEKYGKEEADRRLKIESEKKSIAASGENNSMFGKVSAMKGRTQTDEAKEKVSIAQRKSYASGKRKLSNRSSSITGILLTYNPPIFFGSTSELIFILEHLRKLVRLDRDIYHIFISYIRENGKSATFNPDLGDLKKKIMYEIKGFKKLTKDEELKNIAGEKWCTENGWTYQLKRMPKLSIKEVFLMVSQGQIELLQTKYIKKYNEWLKRKKVA